MAEKDGDVITQVVPDRKAKTLMGEIREHIEPASEIHTDEYKGYLPVTQSPDYKHEMVNHFQKEYVGDNGQTTNTIEGFFAQLKRTIAGTHISVSDKHLWKYAKECEYRFNRRTSPEAMLSELLTRFPELDA